jgi:hypothetical protein
MATMDAVEYAEQCPHCRGIVTHMTALRKIVRPAKELGLEAEKHLGEFLMNTDKTAEMQDLMARCLAMRAQLAAIIASAQVPVKAAGGTEEAVDEDGVVQD